MPIIPTQDPLEGIANALSIQRGFDELDLRQQQINAQSKQALGENLFKLFDIAKTNPKAARVIGNTIFGNMGLDKNSIDVLLKSVDALVDEEDVGTDAAKNLVSQLIDNPNIRLQDFPAFLKNIASNPTPLFQLSQSMQEAKRKEREFNEQRIPVPFTMNGTTQQLPLNIAENVSKFLSSQQQLENSKQEPDVRTFKQFSDLAQQGVPGAKERLEREINGRPLVNIQGPESQSQKRTIDEAFDRFKELRTARIQAINDLSVSGRVASLIDKSKKEGREITSILAPEEKTLGQLLDFFDLSTSDFNEASSNISQLDGLLKRQVVTAAGGKLGGQISDPDRETFAAQVGTARSPQEAIVELQKILEATSNASIVQFNIANRKINGNVDRTKNIQILDDFLNKITKPGGFIKTDDGPQFQYFYNFAAKVLEKFPNANPDNIIQLWNNALKEAQ